MSIFRPSTCKWNDRRGGYYPCLSAMFAVLAAAAVALFPQASGQARKPPPQPSKSLPPFLEDFKLNKEPPTLVKEVTVGTAVGSVTGCLARPDTKEKLPALILIHDEAGLTSWTKQNARELSSIGYVVLAIDLRRRVAAKKAPPGQNEERILAELSAAVRWLRRRPDVYPERVGVVGWSWGAVQALALAASTPLQACVLCDGPVVTEPGILAGLRGTPLLGIYSGQEKARVQVLPAFRQALTDSRIPHKMRVFNQVQTGFMDPGRRSVFVEEAAEDAWLEIYQFLEKHVEDADTSKAQPLPEGPALKSLATVADIMRAVNQPSGVRGRLIQALQEQPANIQEWKMVRAHAAIIAEAARLLGTQKPRKGSASLWREQVRTFRMTAEMIVNAADRRDYTAARERLQELGTRCASCHTQHR